MKRKNNRSNRFTPLEIQQALMLWHQNDGNASAVARILEKGTAKSIIALAEREHFEAKRVLIQHQLNEAIGNSDDPVMKEIALLGLRALATTNKIFKKFEIDVNRGLIRPKSVPEAIVLMKWIKELTEKTLGVNRSSDGESSSFKSNLNMNIDWNTLNPEDKDKFIKMLAERSVA